MEETARAIGATCNRPIGQHVKHDIVVNSNDPKSNQWNHQLTAWFKQHTFVSIFKVLNWHINFPYSFINFLSKLCKAGSQPVNQFNIMKLRFQTSQDIPVAWKYLTCSEWVVELHLFKWINIQSNRVATADKHQTNDCAARNEHCSLSHKVHKGMLHTLITIALIQIANDKWTRRRLNARLGRSGFVLQSHICCKAVEMIIMIIWWCMKGS